MATKAPEVKAVEPAADGADRNPLVEAVRKVLLAGIGAVALAQEEAEDLVNKLVERGQIAEQDGRKLLKDVMERRKKPAEKTAEKAEDALDKRVEELLDRMNVPTKSDLEALSAKIAALTQKVEELKRA